MAQITNERQDHLYRGASLFRFSSIGPICTLSVAIGISPYRLLRLEKSAFDCENCTVTVDGRTYKLPRAAVKALNNSCTPGVTLVFADAHLRPWDGARFDQAWKKTLRSAGIAYQEPDSLLPTVDLHLLDELHKHTHIHYGPLPPKTGRLKRGPISRGRKAGHRKLWIKPP